jgi:hypothetical protein
VEGAAQVGGEDAVPDLVGERVELPVRDALRPARVVHQTVEAAQLTRDLVGHGPDLGIARDVGLDRQGPNARLLGEPGRLVGRRLGLAVVDRHRGPFAGQRQRRRPADAGGASGHQRDLPGKSRAQGKWYREMWRCTP